ncbi:phage tail tape measure protein [Paenibacillus sp. 32352]|uniref:phage tail tape measure protein n=1 Tax=Paenibacillus sp. 32352 TaxID=1969111 RepID=UPI0009ADC68E|nr:phage tail tape measure protein [Paenibacillus sp. 32352]
MGVIGNLMFAIGFKVASDKIKKAERDIDRLSGGMGKLDNSIEGTKNAVFGLGKSFSHIADIGAGMLAGLSFVEIGQGLFHAADDANSAFGRIQAATGATAEQMEATKSVATNLYNQNFGENWDDLGKSISIAQQITKQQGDELENTTRNALLMRDVFEFDIPESVKTADTMYRNFGITTDEAFTLLAQGAQKGLDKSGELLDTANEYSPYFRALGFSANEMFDTFSAGLDAGAFNLDKVGKPLHCRL